MGVERIDDSVHNLMGGIFLTYIFIPCLVTRKRSADLNKKEQTKRKKYALKNGSIIIIKHGHKFFYTPPNYSV